MKIDREKDGSIWRTGADGRRVCVYRPFGEAWTEEEWQAYEKRQEEIRAEIAKDPMRGAREAALRLKEEKADPMYLDFSKDKDGFS